MKIWQKYWIISVILGSVIHSIRDIQQFLGIQSFLSTTLVKQSSLSSHSIIWSPWNTVAIECTLLFLCCILVKRKSFGKLGWTTIIIVAATCTGFLYYWLRA